MEWGHQVIHIEYSKFYTPNFPLDSTFPYVLWHIESEYGIGTHWGVFVSEGEGRFDVLANANEGWGTLTVASGDTLTWTFIDAPSEPPNGEFLGQSGRFAEATGWLEYTITITGSETLPNGDVLQTQEIRGEGMLTY